MGLVRACHLHEAFQVADYLKAKSLKLPLKHFTAIILAMSQRANPMDALDLLNALEGSVAYQTKAIHNYHFHFAKLIVQEFLEEALQTLDRIANAPAFGLQENGLAAMDVVIHGGGKGGSLSLGVPALGEELKRGLMKGDTVMLSRTGEAARTMGGVGGRGDGGFTGEMPTGPRGPQNVEMGAMPTGPRGDSTAAPVGGRGGRAGGGWRADFEFEAEVSSMHPNLSVKLIGCDAAASRVGSRRRVARGQARQPHVLRAPARRAAGHDGGAARDVAEGGRGPRDSRRARRRVGREQSRERRRPRHVRGRGPTRQSERDSKAKDDRPGDGSARHVPHEQKPDGRAGSGAVPTRDVDSRPSRYR